MQAQDLLLFQAALGLSDPWRVTSVEFDRERERLDLRVEFAKGARFPCPECERAGCAVRDTEEKTWRHLDLFQHQAYLTARVPRVDARIATSGWSRCRGRGRDRGSCCCSRRW
jgi:transposase